MKCAVVIEKGPKTFGAHVPDLPGCIAVATTRRDVRRLIKEAIRLHLEGPRTDGAPIPAPTMQVDYVDAVGQER
ncbi:MAG: type II toxin-antitoxin system HicB family antitoxin [Planctomycetota bacterium]